jgi:hypothetical protein
MKRMIIVRTKDDGVQTLGLGLIVDDHELIHTFRTLELPWKENRRRISCIPAGKYVVSKRFTPKFKDHFHVLDVEGRTGILIHVGNFYTQIEGCILPGERFADINKDGLLDVVASRKTLDYLVAIMPDSFELLVVNE